MKLLHALLLALLFACVASAQQAEITASPESGYASLAVQFEVHGSGLSSSDVSWDFGDEKKGTGLLASHLYSSPGTFIAKASIRQGGGNFIGISKNSFHMEELTKSQFRLFGN